MAHPAGESIGDPVQLDFDRRLKLEFHGTKITSDAGLLAYRELDEALGLTAAAGAALSDLRRGRNTRHVLTGLLRQSVYSRLAGYEDVNDAERLSVDPAMCAIVDRRGLACAAASISQMGRFETAWLTQADNVAALSDLPGAWIDRVHARKPPKTIVLDMDSSESPTHGRQEGSAYNAHFGCTCYHPLFCFNQFGDLERSLLRRGNVRNAEDWRTVLAPVVARYRECQLHADVGAAAERGTLVIDDAARQARQDRRQGRAPRPVRHVPAGRDGRSEYSVRRDPAANRRTAAETSATMTRSIVGVSGCPITGQMRPERTRDNRFGSIPALSWVRPRPSALGNRATVERRQAKDYDFRPRRPASGMCRIRWSG